MKNHNRRRKCQKAKRLMK